MKKGMARRVDSLGRIVIPKEVRDAFGIVAGTPLVLSVEGERLVYTKADGGSDVARALDEAIAAIGKHNALDERAAEKIRAALEQARAALDTK